MSTGAAPTEFVLGPTYDGHMEPFPPGVEPGPAPTTPGRRQIQFHPSQPTSPGGIANLMFTPATDPNDKLPVNVYAFFVPLKQAPAPADRTTDWYFKSGAANGSIHSGAADANGMFAIKAAGVQPSLDPYHVATILEFAAG